MGDAADLLERETTALDLRRLADERPLHTAQRHIEALADALEAEDRHDVRPAPARRAVDSLVDVEPSHGGADDLDRHADLRAALSRAALALTGALDAVAVSVIAWQYDAADGGGGDPITSWASEFGGRYDQPSLDLVVVVNAVGLVVVTTLLAFARHARARAERARREGERAAETVRHLAQRSALLLGMSHVLLPPAGPGAAHPRPMTLGSGVGLVWRADDTRATAMVAGGTFSSSWSVAVGPDECWSHLMPVLMDQVLSHESDEPAAYLTTGSGTDVQEVELAGGDVERAMRLVRRWEQERSDAWRLEVEGWAWVWTSSDGEPDRVGVITDRPDREAVDDLFTHTASAAMRGTVGPGIATAFSTVLREVGIDDH